MSSPKRDLGDLARRLAEKARGDEIAVDKLIDDAAVPDEVIGFHAQQAIEKLLKAALAHRGVAPPRIHDLARLGALLEEDGAAPPPAVREARRLTAWAVEFRYDDVLAERLDRERVRSGLADVRRWVDAALAEPSPGK